MFDDAALQDAIERADLPSADAAVLSVQIEGGFEDYLLLPARKGRLAYLFAAHAGELQMVALRPPAASSAPRRAVMCSICMHVLPGSGIGMWTNAPMGDRQSVVGDWVCRGFECKDRIAGRLAVPTRLQLNETLPLEWRRRRMLSRLDRLIGRWLAVAEADGFR